MVISFFMFFVFFFFKQKTAYDLPISDWSSVVCSSDLGVPQKLQPPMEGYYDGLPLATQTMLDKVLRASAIGGQDAVERGLRAFIEKTGADEIIITCQMFDHEARKRSYAIAMDASRAISGEVSLA